MENNHVIEPPDLWECDGSLRDVYIEGTDISDWRTLLEVASRYPNAYTFDGLRKDIPDVPSIFANRSGSHLLTVNVGGASINCHFFISEEIELDIDPRQVTDAATHELVMSFLAELSYAVQKVLVITAENSPKSVYRRFSPSSSSWVNYAQ